MAQIQFHHHIGRGISHGKGYFHRNSEINLAKQLEATTKRSMDVYSSISEESSVETISLEFEGKSSEETRSALLQSKVDECESLQHKLKLIDTAIIILALSGLMFATYEFESNYRNELNIRYISTDNSQRIRIYISVSTAICILLAILRSRYSYHFIKERKVFLEDKIPDYCLSSSFLGLIVEVLILAVHCPPYVNYDFEFKQLSGILYIDLKSVCCSIMMLRLLLLSRMFLHYSKWASLKVQLICYENNVFHPLKFAMKASLKDNPHFVLIPAFCISFLSLGVILQIYERPFNDDNILSQNLDYSYLYNSLWLIVLTMTTVGYGDFYPRTHVGRIICIIACIWGTFLISLLIIMFNNYVSFSRPQQQSFKLLKKVEDYKDVKEAKKKFLKCALEIYMYRRFHGLTHDHQLIIIRNARMRQYKHIWKQKTSDMRLRYNDERDVLIEFNESFTHELKRISVSIAKAQDMDNQLDIIIESQKKTMEILLICSKISREANSFADASKELNN